MKRIAFAMAVALFYGFGPAYADEALQPGDKEAYQQRVQVLRLQRDNAADQVAETEAQRRILAEHLAKTGQDLRDMQEWVRVYFTPPAPPPAPAPPAPKAH